MSLDFSSADFCPATREERISKCRAMAEEAVMKAYWGIDECREGYRLLARHWTGFADEMERAAP
jgi:hypothetical protein